MDIIPIVGTKCPVGYLFDGKKHHTFDDCVNKCTNKCLPEPVLNVMFETLRTDHHKGNYISATALQGCMRKTYLERTRDYYIRPSDRHYDSLRGSLIHETLSRQPSNYIVEQDFYYDFDGVRLFGRVDLYNKDTKRISDFKTTKDLGFDYILKGGKPKKDHVWQANIYKFLLEKGKLNTSKNQQTELFDLPSYKTDEIEIIYMCMKGAAATGAIYRTLDRGAVNEHLIKSVPVLDNDRIEEYIRERIFILNDAFTKDVMPPPPDTDTQKWLCGLGRPKLDGYCEVREQCSFWKEIADEKGIKYGKEVENERNS